MGSQAVTIGGGSTLPRLTMRRLDALLHWLVVIWHAVEVSGQTYTETMTCDDNYNDNGRSCAWFTFMCEDLTSSMDLIPTCHKGSAQSPIDLNLNAATPGDPGAIDFQNYDFDLTLIQTVLRMQDFALQLDFEPSTTPGGLSQGQFQGLFESLTIDARSLEVLPLITGGALGSDKFIFHHAVWHWGNNSKEGSEHYLNGVQYPAEIQLFHWNSKYSYDEAATKPDGLAAVSFFYEMSVEPNPELVELVEATSRLEDETRNMGLDFEVAYAGGTLNDFLPEGGVEDTDNYFHYDGSLTLPRFSNSTDTEDCTQNVKWMIFEKKIPISEFQLTGLRALLKAASGDPNFVISLGTNYVLCTDAALCNSTRTALAKQLSGCICPEDLMCVHNFRPIHPLNPSVTAGGINRQNSQRSLLFRRYGQNVIDFVNRTAPILAPPLAVGGCLALGGCGIPLPGAGLPPPPPSIPQVPPNQLPPNQLNTIETGTQGNTMCQLQGVCEPLIEDHLGTFSQVSVEAVNIAAITAINSRSLSWAAGRTSLLGESFAEVLAYRMGELPPSGVERSGDRTGVRNFLREMEENANAIVIGKKRKKRDLNGFFTALRDAAGQWSQDRSDSIRGIFNSLLEAVTPQRPSEFEVFSTDTRDQGVCSACAAFAVTSAFETCVHRTGNNPGIDGNAPTGLSQQNLLDCGFNSFGLAGCDGGKSFRYMQWLSGGGLEDARYWPYLDGSKKWEVPVNTSLSEGYSRRPGTGRCLYNQEEPSVVLNNMVASWDEHTERDIENILLDGHAVVTTMEVTQDFQFYTNGVFMSDQCQNWHLGHYRDYQWEENRALRHAVVIVGFGLDPVTGFQFWKVKNSWGPLWGESGFFRILKGYGHCGIGAYFAVARCEECSKFGGCRGPKPTTNINPPPNLPQEEVFLGQTTFLGSPIAAQGALTSNTSPELIASQCPATRSCRTRCGPRCRARRGDNTRIQCCSPLGGRGQRVYCPRSGRFCN